MALQNEAEAPFDLQRIQTTLGISPKKIEKCNLTEDELKKYTTIID